MSKSTKAAHTTPAPHNLDEPVDPEVLEFREQFEGRSPLDELVRRGAQQMLQAAIEAEVDGSWRPMPIDRTRPDAGRWCATAGSPQERSSPGPGRWRLHEIWQAETAANEAFDHFLEKYNAKYEGACECLKKDRDVLLTFYDFPAEHWKHLRTTGHRPQVGPIESTFATIRLRHRRTKGNGTRRASLAMMFKLAQSAQKRWRRLNGHALILPLLEGKPFPDGLLQDAA